MTDGWITQEVLFTPLPLFNPSTTCQGADLKDDFISSDSNMYSTLDDPKNCSFIITCPLSAQISLKTAFMEPYNFSHKIVWALKNYVAFRTFFTSFMGFLFVNSSLNVAV